MTAPAELRLRAMGSDAHVVVTGGSTADIERARRRVDDLERRWSRFLDDSEISRLNRSAGERVAVSEATCLLARRAVEARRLTGGAVDVTVLGAMLRAGYDRPFDHLDPDGAAGSDLRLAGTEIEVGDGWVRLPPGSGFDPGGLGKGLAADLVAAEVVEGGAAGVLVNLGGDLRVAGEPPEPPGWTVAVEHPGTPDPVVVLGIEEGAVATSSTGRRTWVRDGVPHHHLIDPATGRPSTTDLTLASVVAGEAWLAEVLAKALLLGGEAALFDAVDGLGAEALAVTAAGEVRRTPGLAAFL